MPTVDEVLEVGAEHAKKAKVIARYCGMTERQVRLDVLQLIEDGLSVASSPDSKEGGFFITATIEEAWAYLDDLQSRLEKIAWRKSIYKQATRSILYPGQLPLV